MAVTVAPTTDAPRGRLERIWDTEPGLFGILGTVDHKTIGKRYLVTALLFMVIGGIEALVMRVQLAQGGERLLTPEQYNQLFTMHGVTMIFFYAQPVLSGFSNFLWPLLMGSRDMAFPRLNAFSYWVYLLAGLFLYMSLPLGQMPDRGWFAYAPLTERTFAPGLNMDFYALALVFLTISTTAGAANFIVSLMKLRAPGMSINRIPIMMWGTLTASAASLVALPALTVACTLLYLDRRFGTHFYDAGRGGHPILWQHLFWMFGHPWVYIIVLPAMGIISDLLPVFCRRPLVGYTYVALATVSTGIIGFGVWVHHIFAAGLPPVSMSYFSAASLVITIPSAIAVFAWLATIWLGRPEMKTPFLFAAGFIVLFVMGGVTGVATAFIPLDWQLTDTYFVVGHLHYVLIGINVFPVMAGAYFWFPKMTGRLLSERLGRWQFWVMFLGFNLGFFPMHIAGLLGMPRRIYTYPHGLGWDTVNLVTSIGAFCFAAGVLLFAINVWRSYRSGEVAGDNPWDGPTLEWATRSPPASYNFPLIPWVESRHPLWDRQLEETAVTRLDEGLLLDQGRETIGTTPLDGLPEQVLRMPGDSLWPLALAASLFVGFTGFLAGAWWVAGAGVVLVTACTIGWLWPSYRREEVAA